MNKRPFKKGDRVCERHFQEDELVLYWENTVRGKLVRTQRDKPTLKGNVVPSVNLFYLATLTEGKYTRKTPVVSEKIIRKRSSADKPEADFNNAAASAITYSDILASQVQIKKIKIEKASLLAVNVHPQPQNDVNDDNEKDPLNVSNCDMQSVSQNENETLPSQPLQDIDDEILEQFESLYDEVNDITYPTTLWGVHRCGERKFIVFSSFHRRNMAFDKFLYIDQRLTCKVSVNGKLTETSLEKKNCNSDYVSDWLDRIDRLIS